MDLQDIYSLETINSHSTLTGGINKVILFPSKIASERHKCNKCKCFIYRGSAFSYQASLQALHFL